MNRCKEYSKYIAAWNSIVRECNWLDKCALELDILVDKIELRGVNCDINAFLADQEYAQCMKDAHEDYLLIKNIMIFLRRFWKQQKD